MRSSGLSDLRSETSPTPGTRMVAAVWLVRVILGGVFVFSGFSKAVDPWGGLYKIADYFAAWGIGVNHEFALTVACGLAAFEFVLGVMILTGAYRRSSRWIALGFMAFMTVLTLYIWIADPVSDCGCFGDALVLSNGATLAKNVVLLALAWACFRWNGRVGGLINSRLQWLAMVATVLYVFAIEAYGYIYQPMIDFRPYPEGSNLFEKVNEDVDAAGDMTFVYEKDGEKKEFTVDNLPDDDEWTFVERKAGSDTEQGGDNASLAFFDDEGDDVTTDIIYDEGLQFILLISDPARYGIARSEMANRLWRYAEDRGADMFAVVAMSPSAVPKWIEATDAEYPVYTAEDTDLKMLARGDAALVVVRDGVIKYKTNVFALPPEFPDMSDQPALLRGELQEHPLAKFTFIWIAVMLAIYVISRFMGHVFRKKSTENPIAPDEQDLTQNKQEEQTQNN